jgi:hypothetical protein
MNVLKLFLAFTFSFQPYNAHNMLVLILDPHFKSLQIIWDYVGVKVAMQIVIEYDHKVLILLLLTIYKKLTLIAFIVELWMLFLNLVFLIFSFN